MVILDGAMKALGNLISWEALRTAVSFSGDLFSGREIAMEFLFISQAFQCCHFPGLQVVRHMLYWLFNSGNSGVISKI